jgi:hypothetical protein
MSVPSVGGAACARVGLSRQARMLTPGLRRRVRRRLDRIRLDSAVGAGPSAGPRIRRDLGLIGCLTGLKLAVMAPQVTVRFRP